MVYPRPEDPALLDARCEAAPATLTPSLHLALVRVVEGCAIKEQSIPLRARYSPGYTAFPLHASRTSVPVILWRPERCVTDYTRFRPNAQAEEQVMKKVWNVPAKTSSGSPTADSTRQTQEPGTPWVSNAKGDTPRRVDERDTRTDGGVSVLAKTPVTPQTAASRNRAANVAPKSEAGPEAIGDKDDLRVVDNLLEEALEENAACRVGVAASEGSMPPDGNEGESSLAG